MMDFTRKMFTAISLRTVCAKGTLDFITINYICKGKSVQLRKQKMSAKTVRHGKCTATKHDCMSPNCSQSITHRVKNPRF